jgi:cytochrome c-type biogenesis protein CcmH
MRRKNALLLAPLGLIMLAMAVVACGNSDTPSLEEQAYSIDRSLICPVCPGETIDQAQVELARQMRLLVREKLAEGWSRERILQFFVDRYGEAVLAEPPKSGFNLLAWIVPFVSVFAALVLLFFVVKSMRKSSQAQRDGGIIGVGSPPSEEELGPYLAMVDRDLGSARQEPPSDREDGPQSTSHPPGEGGTP